MFIFVSKFAFALRLGKAAVGSTHYDRVMHGFSSDNSDPMTPSQVWYPRCCSYFQRQRKAP
jgi:hypothetical protein